MAKIFPRFIALICPVTALVQLALGTPLPTPSSVVLASSLNPARISQAVTLTATVSPSGAAGTVTFYDGAAVLGIGTISGGAATLSQQLPTGAHSLKARYSGSSLYSPSLSAALSQTVTSLAEMGFQPPISTTLSGQAREVAVGDFNSDGKADFVVSVRSGQLQLFLNNGSGGFTKSTFGTATQHTGVAVGDFNGDGKADIADCIYGVNGAVSIYLGNGDSTFKPAVTYGVGSIPYHVSIGDFNNDGIEDLAIPNSGSNDLSILIGKGDGTFLPQVRYAATGTLSFFTSIADFNGDGNADIVVPNNGSANLTLFIGNGDGTFKAGVNMVTRVEPYTTLATDLNGDGKQDIVVTCAHQFSVGVYLGNGDGTFQAPVYYNGGAEPHFVLPADTNGDGKVDLIISDFEEAAIQVLPGNGDGTFQPHIAYFATGPLGTPNGLAMADFNQDGAVDFVTVDFHSSTAVVRLGSTTATTDVQMPNIIGLTQAAATIALHNAGLNVGTVGSDPHTAPVGTVIDQLEYSNASPLIPYSPNPGTFLPVGDNVDMVLSSGPGMVPVIELVEQTVATATMLLGQNGLALGNVTSAPSNTVQPGNIISQNPLVATTVATGTSVDVVVSTGSGGAVLVPNVVGQTQSAATTAIQGAGLVLGTVTMASSNTVAAGSVISQNPAAGTSSNAGTSVTLVVSSGVSGVSVPNVVGLTQSAAMVALQGAGLIVGTVTNATSSTVAAGNVISENPTAGTLVSAGTSVSLTVSTGPAAQGGGPVNSTGGGSGLTNTFTFTFSNPSGFTSVQKVNILINNFLDGRQGCYLAFVPSSASAGSLFLVDDAGDAGGPFSGLVLPGASTVQNSQCTVNGTGASLTGSGTTLTLTLPITFSAGFAGSKIVYLAEADTNGYVSPWQALATWKVPGAATVTGPSVTGMTPSQSSSATQLYTFTFTDTNGWQDIQVADILVNNFLDGRQGCYLAVVPSTGSIFLVDDAGDAGGPYSGMTLPGTGAVSNSQCGVSAVGGSITGSGNNLTVTLSMTFNHAFAGNRVFYLSTGGVIGNQNSGWQSVGNVSVP